MTTVKIEIEPFLAEYATGRFFDEDRQAVVFPDSTDLYVTIGDLMQRRPPDRPIDRGNLEFALPHQRNGKRPETYNYISERGAAIIASKLRIMMWAELHDAMEQNKHLLGIQYKDTVYMFLTRYGIESISEDALLKNYQRWRQKCRRRHKRSYGQQKSKKN